VSASVCRHLVTVVELHQSRVPALNFDVSGATDLGHDLRRFFGIERGARIALWDEFGVICTVARTCRNQPARSDDPPRLGEGEPRIVQVIEHPEEHDGVKALVCQGQLGGVGPDYGTVRTISELTRGLVNAKPLDAPSHRGGKSTDATPDIENPPHPLTDEAFDYRPMDILLPARPKRPRPARIGVVVGDQR
jgi:hypothetical protein